MRETDNEIEGKVYDRMRDTESLLSKHVAECAILRQHLEDQVKNFRHDIRGVRNLILASAGVIIGGLGTVIMFMIDKVWK